MHSLCSSLEACCAVELEYVEQVGGGRRAPEQEEEDEHQIGRAEHIVEREGRALLGRFQRDCKSEGVRTVNLACRDTFVAG